MFMAFSRFTRRVTACKKNNKLTSRPRYFKNNCDLSHVNNRAQSSQGAVRDVWESSLRILVRACVHVWVCGKKVRQMTFCIKWLGQHGRRDACLRLSLRCRKSFCFVWTEQKCQFLRRWLSSSIVWLLTCDEKGSCHAQWIDGLYFWMFTFRATRSGCL